MHAGCVHVTFGVGINPEFAVHGKLLGVAAEICSTLGSPLHPVPTSGWQQGSSQKWRNSLRIQGENYFNHGGIDLRGLQGNF